jgi:hypothetical protein
MTSDVLHQLKQLIGSDPAFAEASIRERGQERLELCLASAGVFTEVKFSSACGEFDANKLLKHRVRVAPRPSL